MIEELDYQLTALGELILRRRRSPNVRDELVYEVKLGDEMLMSSSVNDSERALARLALERFGETPCDVLIGGLGLGYTAVAALDSPHVRRVEVVELLAPVIEWHRARLVPAADRLLDDSRCTFTHADFFEHISAAAAGNRRSYHVILVDIDHSPDCVLHSRHERFYTLPWLKCLHDRLHPNGVFALWSADEPSTDFMRILPGVFAGVDLHEVRFRNPHMRQDDSNWIVVCQRGKVGTNSGACTGFSPI